MIPVGTPSHTVDKFGIAVAGATNSGPMRQVRRKDKFRVTFFGFGDNSIGEPITLNVNTIKLPSSTQEIKEVHSYMSTAYYGGRVTWDTCSLDVRDTVDNEVVKAIGAQKQKQLNHYTQTGYQAAQDYKFTTIIQYLTGGTDIAEAYWTLEGCFLSKVDFGQLDYSSADAVTINMDIRMDNAILSQGGGEDIFTTPATDSYGSLLSS